MQLARLLPEFPRAADIFPALDRLDSLGREGAELYEEMDEDLQYVHTFGHQLSERGESIADAIVATWLLARVAGPAEESAALSAAWNALTDRLDVGGSSSQLAVDFAEKLFDALQKRFGDPKAPYISPVSLKQYLQRPWTHSLEEAVSRIKDKSPQPVADWADCEKKAWFGWGVRARAFLEQKPLPVYGFDSYTLDQLLCAVTGRGPDRLLKADLGQTTLRSCGTLTYRWFPNSAEPGLLLVPRWAVVFALWLCGQTKIATEVLAPAKEPSKQNPVDFDPPPGLMQLLQTVSTTASRRSGALLVLAEEESIATAWLPSKTTPCLAYTRNQLSELGSSDYLRQVFEYIVIELEKTDDIDTTLSGSVKDLLAARGLQSKYEEGRTQIGVLINRPPPEKQGEVRALYQATSLDDAISRLSVRQIS